MMIEPVLEVFGTFHSEVIARLRSLIFEEFAKTDNFGLIFTYMWAFDQQSDWDYIAHVRNLFHIPDADVYHIELLAPQDVRLQRNATENRLAHKPSKRDLEASNLRILNDDLRYRCESFPGELTFPNYLRLPNSGITACDAAARIKAHFGFPDA